jgi:hypothetical protein
VELNPVRRRRPADEHEVVLLEVEQDAVADHVPAVAARDELLGAVDGEVREAVDREVRAQLHCVGALDVDVDHVVRLIEQHGALPPCGLLVAPVRKFARYDGVDVSADARIAQKVDGIFGCFEDVL